MAKSRRPWLARVLQWDQMASVRRAAALHVDFGVQGGWTAPTRWRLSPPGHRAQEPLGSRQSQRVDIEFNGTVRAHAGLSG
ncbi:MAG: hypothetical protein R2911_39175 [Caldilineaceae bacterium]